MRAVVAIVRVAYCVLAAATADPCYRRVPPPQLAAWRGQHRQIPFEYCCFLQQSSLAVDELCKHCRMMSSMHAWHGRANFYVDADLEAVDVAVLQS